VAAICRGESGFTNVRCAISRLARIASGMCLIEGEHVRQPEIRLIAGQIDGFNGGFCHGAIFFRPAPGGQLDSPPPS
jgi:hypothetical protein